MKIFEGCKIDYRHCALFYKAHFKTNTKRCEWEACWWSKCVDKKSFQGPKAFSRHKSRQQKAFTTLTQNETNVFLGLENDFAPFHKDKMQYWTRFYYSIIFLRLVATQILEFNEMPQNWASRPNYSRLTVTAEKTFIKNTIGDGGSTAL